MAKFLIRVDDLGWVPPSKNADTGLQYFAKWRDSFGSAGLPIYYGAIPALMGVAELQWCRENLSGGERLAVHGYDHARGAKVTLSQMHDAALRFTGPGQPAAYIAPFNDYSPATIRDWSLACGHKANYFFGGFHNDNHQYGHYPTAVDGNAIHIPAFRPLYDHTAPLIEAIPKYADLDCLLVVTLHCTWSHERLDLLPKLMELLRPHLVSLDEVPKWLDKTRLNLKRLKSAQYQAQKYVLDRIAGNGPAGVAGIGERVLDFGARDGELAAQMALRGCRVTACDRDPDMPSKQRKNCVQYGVNVRCWSAGSADELDCGPRDFDCVTSTWAIQHNLPAETEVPKIAASLSRRIVPGGRILIVASHTPGESFAQMDRKDPQMVLSWLDHQRLIVEPTRCALHGKPHFFRYEHSTTNGGPCEMKDANAVAYELRKAK